MSTEGLMATVPERPAAGGPAWLARLRTEAAERLRTGGFPTTKDEAWRFTSVRPIVSVPFRAREAGGTEEAALAALRARFADEGAFTVFVVDGVPRIEGEAPAGLEVMGFEAASRAMGDTMEARFGHIAKAGAFVALNAALFRDALVVRARAGARVEEPVHVVHVTTKGDAPVASYPRVLVVAEDGSELSFVETFVVDAHEGLPASPVQAAGEGPAGAGILTNAVTEVAVGANASVDHVRILIGEGGSYHLGALAVRVERDARYVSRVVTLGGALSRLDLSVLLAGEGAECTLEGAYLTRDGEHVDHHTFIDHAQAHGTSRESYRGVLDGKSRAVFDGSIVVRRDAQKTNAHQENRNLLLSDDAVVNTKPHLEIDADDVKCSHGATVGSLDEDQLFYLRARGIDADTARAVLTFAFLRSVVDRIPEEAVRQRLADALVARLPGANALGEMP